MKNLMLIVLFVLSNTISFSQENYAFADSVAVSVKAASVETLHRELTKNLTTDQDKVRSFFFWIAQNINYDVSEWTNPSGDFSKQQPANVLKNMKAVCHGYSQLFKVLCDLSGIKCFIVTGYTRNEAIFSGEGHAWNVIYLNGKWQQIDATWGAGGV